MPSARCRQGVNAVQSLVTSSPLLLCVGESFLQEWFRTIGGSLGFMCRYHTGSIQESQRQGYQQGHLNKVVILAYTLGEKMIK